MWVPEAVPSVSAAELEETYKRLVYILLKNTIYVSTYAENRRTSQFRVTTLCGHQSPYPESLPVLKHTLAGIFSSLLLPADSQWEYSTTPTPQGVNKHA